MVLFTPDWTRHQKAAPFKRDNQLLEVLPIGVVFPGSGVTDNLADKAKAIGVPLLDVRKAGGTQDAAQRLCGAHAATLGP